MKKTKKIKLKKGRSKAFVFSNLSKTKVFPSTRLLAEYLLENRIEVYMDKPAEELVAVDGVCYRDFDSVLPDVDIVFIVGGDGTILRAAKHAIKYDKPIIGINAGRLGFLSDIEAESISMIGRIFEEGCPVEERMILEVKNGNEKALAVNDVFISKTQPGKTAELFVECNGHEVCRYRADGIVLSTPDGSTAYSMSAGGPVLDTNLDAIIMTPVCPHSLISCSVVFSPEKLITVGAEFSGGEKVLDVVVDGERTMRLKKGEKLEVASSGKRVKFINLSGRGFYEILNQKIIGRR